MQKAIVIGSNGYLGRHLADYLQQQGFATALYDLQGKSLLPQQSYARLDITQSVDFDQLDATADFIFFMAGLTGTGAGFDRHEEFIRANETGLLLLILFFVVMVIQTELLEHGAVYSLIISLSQVGFPFLFGILTVVTAKRSSYAQLCLEEIAGYMTFIKAVEKPRLKLMVESDPQLFYHVLGYAIVLGLESVWAKKFKGIAIEQASWYVGPRPIADALFYSALSSRIHSSVMEKAIYTQSGGGSRSPIHSSFGSSGFSGGGFGGGGGGAW